MYHLVIIQTLIFGCCDFIAQSILVRTTSETYYSLYSPGIFERYIVATSCGVTTYES